jgi:hypothetical protein
MNLKSMCNLGKVAGFRLLPYLALMLVLGTACSDSTTSSPPSRETAPTTNTTEAAAASIFHPLLGKWNRLDGDYMLEFRSVDAAGKLDAGYFNPGPIHISKAIAMQDGGEVKVFVELRDVNYPGCTYSLAYSKSSNQLVGTYFQAAMGQTFDVVFSRAIP